MKQLLLYDLEHQLIEDFGTDQVDDLIVSENPEQSDSYLVLTPTNDFLVYHYHREKEEWMSTTLLEYQEELMERNVLL